MYDLVSEALRLLEERDTLQEARLQALKHDIAQGMASLEKGEYNPFDINAIKARGRAKREGS